MKICDMLTLYSTYVHTYMRAELMMLVAWLANSGFKTRGVTYPGQVKIHIEQVSTAIFCYME